MAVIAAQGPDIRDCGRRRQVFETGVRRCGFSPRICPRSKVLERTDAMLLTSSVRSVPSPNRTHCHSTRWHGCELPWCHCSMPLCLGRSTGSDHAHATAFGCPGLFLGDATRESRQIPSVDEPIRRTRRIRVLCSDHDVHRLVVLFLR